MIGDVPYPDNMLRMNALRSPEAVKTALERTTLPCPFAAVSAGAGIAHHGFEPGAAAGFDAGDSALCGAEDVGKLGLGLSGATPEFGQAE